MEYLVRGISCLANQKRYRSLVYSMNEFYNKLAKRIIDFLAALIAFIIFIPVMIAIIILLKITGHSRLFFVQKRVGKNEKIFYLFKFRSMTEAKDANGKLFPDDKRLTKFGRTLRKTSLDELPQLL